MIINLNAYGAGDPVVEGMAVDQCDALAGFEFFDGGHVITGDEFVFADFAGVGFAIGQNGDLSAEF
jgi:hypothetical protein